MRIAWQAVAAWRCNPTCSLPLALGARAVLTALRTPCGARSARHVVSVRVLMTAPCVGVTACALVARWAQAPRRIAQSIWICEGQRTAIPQYAWHRVGDDCAYQVGAPRARPLSARARTIAACGVTGIMLVSPGNCAGVTGKIAAQLHSHAAGVPWQGDVTLIMMNCSPQ